ncbi:MAG: ABC transporter substrate-binding protein [Rhodospirillaceae bacterium]|jgi:NitT/TauT family transport system substrate-binding protein
MTISLYENFRGLFYAPYYAAFEIGAYDKAGVDVEFVAAKVMGEGNDAIDRGDGVVAWGGPMRVLKDHAKNPDSELISFCEVVGRDPFIILGHEPKPGFKVQDLKDLKFASFTEAPTPWNCLQEDLRRAGVDPQSLDRLAGGAQDDNIEKFLSGSLDAVQVLEPNAEKLLSEGKAHIWFEGTSRGPCSYTTFYARRSFVDEHESEMLAMVKAMAETLAWVDSVNGDEIAKTIKKYFPDEDSALLGRALERYRKGQLWNKTPAFSRAGLERLHDGLVSNDFIEREVSFEEIIDSRFDKP